MRHRLGKIFTTLISNKILLPRMYKNAKAEYKHLNRNSKNI